MEPTLDSKTSTESSKMDPVQIKAASAPIVPLKSEETKLKVQLSAPSYLNSLRENDAPPFRRPGREARPRLLIGTIMNEEEAIEMIAAADSDKENGLRRFLAYFLVEKKVTENFNLSEKSFLIGFLSETIEYAARRDFSAFKLAVLITLYLHTHLYFKWYYWQAPAAVWFYFKEIMIRHTIEDSPDGQEVFEPDECYDIISHFHTVYIANLPLVHILTFGAHRLKFLWPFKPK
ncbi:uncharacterized protein LOC135088375 [Ostrinia nubilalis]|uniref:uncharacterized protein LOC135088375 n=1 Tax=Ostrinia nubilalis TaxID=29057 RepID=UPI0030825BB0